LFFRCLLMRGPSALVYQLGFSLAVIVVFSSVAGILHYVPSPSLFTYARLRFFSGTQSCKIIFIRMFQYSIVLTIRSKMKTLVAVFSNKGLFFFTFPVEIRYFQCMLFGIGLVLCFGIKDATSFRIILPSEFSMTDSAVSLCVGFIVSFFQLTSSSFLYQAYFPIPTLHKLRLTLAFYGVFQLFSSILVFLTMSLFFAFMDKRCSIVPYSYQSFFRFTSVRSYMRKMFCVLKRNLVFRTLGSIICGVFVCGYFLPFCNSKGLCFPSALDSFLFQITVLICPIVSFFTGGQDQMCLDWNLVVIPCSASLTSRSTYGKRPFVASESFRYAQHTSGPGLLKPIPYGNL
uniref:7TM_GPCR_Srx domain-containing protein n=1 Tax=Angiostrongylus cantonensis TaxID=6313 RepID=A0A0K0DK01_ANGCA